MHPMTQSPTAIRRLIDVSVTLLPIMGLVAFFSVIIHFLWQAPQLTAHFCDVTDLFWLKTYASAIGGIGVLVWFRRGRLLLLMAVLAAGAIVLTSTLSGGTGWAIPKLICVTALAVGLGHRCLKWLHLSSSLSPFQLVLFTAIIGYGGLALLMLALGLLHFWRADLVAVVLLALSGAVCRDFAQICRRAMDEWPRLVASHWRGSDLRLPALVASALVVCGFGCYVSAAAPNTHWDVLHYHLGIPAIYVERGGIEPLDHTYAVHLVHNAEMIYAIGLLIEGQPLPTLFNFLFGLLAVGVVAEIGALLSDRLVGWLAGAIFFAVPLVSYVLAEGLIDLVLTAYVLAAIYAFCRWRREGDPGWAALFSLFAGIACGTKLNAAIFLLPVAVAAFVHALRWQFRWRNGIVRVLQLVLPGAVVLTPWLLIGWVRTGNPVFPFLNNIFQSPEWFQTSIADGVDWSGFGVGKNWWHALRLPWDLAFHGDRFGELGWYATGGIVLFGLPFGYFAASPRQRKPMLALTLLTALSLVVFFKVAQYARYMLPLTALCAIVAAMNCHAAWRVFTRHPRTKWLPLATSLAIGLGWLLFSRAVDFSTRTHWHPGRYPWQVAFGVISAEDYLKHSSLREYEALMFIDQQLHEKPVVFVGAGLGAGVYSGDAVEYSRWHSLTGKRLFEERSQPALLSTLAEKKVRYFAVNEEYVQSNSGWQKAAREAAVLRADFLRRHCEPLFGRNGFVVYRLWADGIDTSAADEPPSLVETAIKRSSDGALAGWQLANGKLNPLPEGAYPSRPDVTVLNLTHTDCICKGLEVRENTLYTLSADFWSGEPEQACMLQLQWLDEAHRQLANEVSRHEVGPIPARYEMSRTSSPGARYAVVYLRAREGNTVRMAEPRLVERMSLCVPPATPLPTGDPPLVVLSEYE